MNRIALFIAVLLAAGCAGVAPVADLPVRGGAQAQACLRWFAEADAAVEAGGVRDAGAYRIPGFPYLRADRFTASFREEALRGPQPFGAWIGRLRELDLQARAHEFGNLGASGLARLGLADAGAALERAARCGDLLAREDGAAPEMRQALAARATVPDDYDAAMRASFFNAVATEPFAAGVADWQRETEALFRRAAEAPGVPGLRRYAPAASPAAPTPAQLREIVVRAPRDALGVPHFSAAQADALLRAYAPQLEIEDRGAHDRFGALAWKEGRVPEVDAARPVAYGRLAFTRFGGRTLVQLVYAFWFPERPAERFFDLLAGKLDGLVVRISLDEDGAPLMADSIHACGCYHLFFPTPRLRARPAPDPREEWAFSPATLPELPPGRRLALRVASGSHYVVAIRPAADGADEGASYGFAEDDTLRSLPLPGGGARSAFGPDGIIAGSDRLESLFFWPMGIANAGAMRQWGRHATAFLGRRHFDDADLLEKRFARAER